MDIRSQLKWLIAIGLAGLVVFAAVTFVALMQIRINGPIYQRISLSQNLVSDYVPPPENLLQVALACNMLNETSDPAERQRYLEQLQKAQRLFETQYAGYMRRVPEGKLKDMIRGTAYQSAEQYLQIAQQSFLPLVAKGDHDSARNVLLTRMKPLYEKHAAAVDEIVAVANQESKDDEALAARRVRSYTIVLLAVGLGVLLAGGLLSFAIARGISRQTQELQSSFERLRALASRLQHIREEERTRVAREIHDELGQSLTAIKLDTISMLNGLPADQREKLTRAPSTLALIDETIQSVRRIATELRPGMLDDLGLVATIEWAGEEFVARTGTKCRLDLPQEDIVIDKETATAVFRIFQETLTNVTRHAAASEVNVRLALEDGHLTLEVLDDGKGIPQEKLQKGKSLGILGMRERAALLGGDLTITAPGRGTAVRVRIPQSTAV